MKAGIEICPMNPFYLSHKKMYSITLPHLCFSYTLEQQQGWHFQLCVCRWGPYQGGCWGLCWAQSHINEWLCSWVTYLPLYVNPREGVLDEWNRGVTVCSNYLMAKHCEFRVGCRCRKNIGSKEGGKMVPYSHKRAVKEQPPDIQPPSKGLKGRKS